MNLNFALVGNPNSGKTTLYNELTGSKAHVGNWPGVTVELKTGTHSFNGETSTIVDLPGIYSLSPYSEDEVVSRNYIFNNKIDVIVNIIDATNIERNLYLTTQILETGIKTVIALNMMDEIESHHESFDVKNLEKELGVKIVPISAAKNKGIDELIQTVYAEAKEATSENITITKSSYYPYAKKIYDILKENDIDNYFLAVKLLEKDSHSLNEIPENVKTTVLQAISEMEKELNINSFDIIIAEGRYSFIEDILQENYIKQPPQVTVSEKIDKVVTHKVFAIPIFLLTMLCIFQLTFGPFGSSIVSFLNNLLDNFTIYINTLLVNNNASPWAVSLITEGVIPGIGMVLVILPQILILFFFLALMEDSGYMARAAFIMDNFLRRFGLSGKSFIPMLMGFGCSVPAIMATRTLENKRDKRLTIILTPFMSCGARLPVYAVFASALFPKNKTLVIFSLYFLGIIIAILSGILLKNTLLKGEPSTFIMELPPYRLPSMKSVYINIINKAGDFVKKAFTILLAASIIIWFLQSFNFQLQMTNNNYDSILGKIGVFIAPIFSPLGFGEWRATVSLITGLIAKEAVVSTLSILYSVGNSGANPSSLQEVISSNFTMLSAYSYMAFVLLYTPCVVAFSAISKEMNSWKWTLFAVAFQTSTAYIVSLLIYQIGSLFLA